jgi:hypothetical protein
MTLVHPDPFTLTDAEVAVIQSAQMGRHAKAARRRPLLIVGSVAVAAAALAGAWATDRIWSAPTLPVPLSLMLLASFITGMAVMIVTFRLNFVAARRRLRKTARQIFESRTVALLAEGIEQTQPTSRLLTLWSGIDRTEVRRGIILVWTGNLLAATVPVRAFPTRAAAESFRAEVDRRAAGPEAPRKGARA